MRQYKIAYMIEATGDWDIVEEFEAENDEEANRYAEAACDNDNWYVLDADNDNING